MGRTQGGITMPENTKKPAQWRWEDVQTEQRGAYINMCLPDPEAGEIQRFPVALGINLSFIRINTELWPVPPQGDSGRILLLNYCLNGRCEVALSNGTFMYLSEGLSALALQQLAKPSFYPTAFYEGVEVFLDLDILWENPYPLFENHGVEISAICVNFRLADTFCRLRLPSAIMELFTRLWTFRSGENTSGMKLQLAEILLEISHLKRPRTADAQYYTATQVDIAKKVHAMLIEDLAVNYTVQEMADQFWVSEVNLKAYFKGVYGESISAFLSRTRMACAAHLLETTKLKIGEVAFRSGYDNQSKFAAVFRRDFHISPLEYRRRNRLEQV